jgi:hypothetical protein
LYSLSPCCAIFLLPDGVVGREAESGAAAFDHIRSNPLLKGGGDQERLPFALNEAVAETPFGRFQL